MKPQILLSVLALCFLFPTLGYTRDIPKNVNLAAKAMYAAARMEPANMRSNKYQSNGTHACSDMGGNPCVAWYKDFKEDLNYYVSVHDKVIYIAFRGTWGSANETMNNNGKPIMKHGRWVHKGWWDAKNKAWEKIRPYVTKYGKGRKIIITGQSMGGVMAAYITKTMLHDRKTKNLKIRLVTFGAPRYTLSYAFFPKKKNFYVYTMENKYWNGKKWKTDPVAFEWEKALRKNSKTFFKKADTKRPKDKRKRTWTVKCKTGAKNGDQAHASDLYYQVAIRSACDN